MLFPLFFLVSLQGQGDAHQHAKSEDAHAHHEMASDEAGPSIIQAYLKIQQLLASDSITGVAEAANAIIAGSEASFPEIGKTAAALAQDTEIRSARKDFKALSDAVIAAVESGKLKVHEMHLAYCPMAQSSWLQDSKDINNPYYGHSMLKCGVIKKSFDGSDHSGHHMQNMSDHAMMGSESHHGHGMAADEPMEPMAQHGSGHAENHMQNMSHHAMMGSESHHGHDMAADDPDIDIRTISVQATEFKFSPATITVEPGETFRLKLENVGSVVHMWQIEGLEGTHVHAEKGTTASGIITAPSEEGTYKIFCSEPGHKEAGMIGQLVVAQHH